MPRLLIPLLFVCAVATAQARSIYPLPPHPEPHLYGTILMDRVSTAKGVKPVVFSHWLHRARISCAVCHSELEFELKTGETEISEADNQSGRYCGACHNGELVFGPKDNCQRCHNGDLHVEKARFEAFMASKPFPSAPFGNGIDWVRALRRGLIEPARFLENVYEEMPFDKELQLQAEMMRIPPAIFPHKAHSEWMDCNLCHPAIFNIKAKTTKHFRMSMILKGEFCGACHRNVAFPMDDCSRCHPGMKE